MAGDGTFGPLANGGTRFAKLRCPGKDTREVDFRLQLDQAPASGTEYKVRATTAGEAPVERTTTVP